MGKNRIEISHEACPNRGKNEWALSLQWCRFVYEEYPAEFGYRFMWRRPNDNLAAYRGGCRIDSINEMLQLIEIAKKEGWGDYDARKPPWTKPELEPSPEHNPDNDQCESS